MYLEIKELRVTAIVPVSDTMKALPLESIDTPEGTFHTIYTVHSILNLLSLIELVRM